MRSNYFAFAILASRVWEKLNSYSSVTICRARFFVIILHSIDFNVYKVNFYYAKQLPCASLAFNLRFKSSGFEKAMFVPDCVVIAPTARALKLHGGVDKKDLVVENLTALKAGIPNLIRCITSVYRLPCVVAINKIVGDTAAHVNAVFCKISQNDRQTLTNAQFCGTKCRIMHIYAVKILKSD